MTRPKFNQLQMLTAVADAGSFGGAAAALQCTQSRISHGITQLEQTLGMRLLIRSRTGCVPTSAGQRVLLKARQILRLADSLAQVADQQAALTGRVRIACFRSIATHLLPHALEALAAEHPGIRVDIDDSCEEREQVTQAVRDGRADIGIAQLPAGPEFAARDFIADDYVLVAPAALPLRAPLQWEQLAGLPYIQLDCSGALAILAQCRAAGFQANAARTLATDSGIAAMVRRGLGYSILPRLAIYPEPDGVQIAALPIPAQRRFALVALPETARLQLTQTVMACIGNQRLVKSSDAYQAGLIDY